MKNFKCKIIALIIPCLTGCSGLADSTSIRRAHPSPNSVKILEDRKQEWIKHCKQFDCRKKIKNKDSFSIELAAWYGLLSPQHLHEVVLGVPLYIAERLAQSRLPISRDMQCVILIPPKWEDPKRAKARKNTQDIVEKYCNEEAIKNLEREYYQEEQEPAHVDSGHQPDLAEKGVVSVNTGDSFPVDRAKVFSPGVMSIICSFMGVTKTYFLMKRISKDWYTTLQNLHPLEKEWQKLRSQRFDKKLIEDILRNHCADYISMYTNFFKFFHPVELKQLFKQYPELLQECLHKTYKPSIEGYLLTQVFQGEEGKKVYNNLLGTI